MNNPLPVLYEDENYIAVNKPPELLVHKTDLCRDRIAALQIVRDQIGGAHVYPTHRLDRGTCGVLLFAKSPEANRFAATQFENREVRKSYLTVIRGWPKEESGIEDSPIKKENGEKVNAISHFKVIFKVDYPYPVSKFPTSRYSMIRVFPKTGRMHQIRRHMRRISGPVIGDSNYGDTVHNHFFRDHLSIKNLFLFAESLSFKTIDGKEICVNCPLPTHFEEVMKKFKWEKELLPSIDFLTTS